MKKNNYSFFLFRLFHILFFLLYLILIISCSEKPLFNNPYDPDTDPQSWEPSNLQFMQLSVNSIKLLWQDNCNLEEGFKIDKKVGTNFWQNEYSSLAENIEEWTDENAEINEILQYRVYAFSVNNNSTSIETGVIDNTFQAPENLTYTIGNISVNTADIHLFWDYNAQGIYGFKVEKNGAILAETVPSGSTGWVDIGINISESYNYRVLAFYQSYNSAFSNEVSWYCPEALIFVQGGTFDMGDHYNEGSSDELPVHSVTLDDFFLGKYEVTHAEYIEFLNDYGVNSDGSYNGTELIVIGSYYCAIKHNGSSFYFEGCIQASSDDCPVMNVTWYGAVVYCNWKSQHVGLSECYNLSDWSCDFSANGFRLPTEAEWEYAARGGINWTDDYRYSGCDIDELSNYAWYGSNSNDQTHPVGTKLANQLEIHDMTGNVWEWCNDWYSSSYYSSSPSNNPTGPISGNVRVLRGSCWSNLFFYNRLRVAGRYIPDPYDNFRYYGFRTVRCIP